MEDHQPSSIESSSIVMDIIDKVFGNAAVENEDVGMWIDLDDDVNIEENKGMVGNEAGASIISSTTNLSNTILGAGLLGLPYGMYIVHSI